MNKYKLNLNQELGSVDVEIYHKNIKNINLKVCTNKKVKISVPLRIDNEWVKKHLLAKRAWIIKQLSRFHNVNFSFETQNICSVQHIYFLGKKLKIKFVPASKSCLELTEDELNIYVLENKTCKQIDSLFNKFWKNCAKQIFQDEMDKLYADFFHDTKTVKPNLFVRKMKTLWGSCIPSKNKITINEHLLKKDMKCIQYVILHELTHLLYIRHDKDFYGFLSKKMPDWKERKKTLSS